MAERVVSMEVRLAIAAFELVDDGQVSVSRVCAENLEVSRDTFYRYRARYEQEGWVGLMPRSRRPLSSPGATPEEMVEIILAKRRELLEQGWDAGARSIHARLEREGVAGLPTPRTVHRVLVRAGAVQAEPAKRPRSSFKRFEHSAPNGCWQIDGTGWHLAQGQLVCILRVLDDHSRMILASRAAAEETSVEAWACVEAAIERHGRPAMLLSDGGTAFTTRRLGPRAGLGDFEARLRALGINPVVSSPHHPQTCGKKERDWQPLKRWLAVQPAARTLTELQQLLDVYDVLFNTERPHQSLGGLTPAERYNATEKATPDPTALPPPCQVTEKKVAPSGLVDLGNSYRVCIGAEWTGHRVVVVRDHLDVVILNGNQIVLRLRIDPTRKYQRTGRPHTHRRKRLTSELS